MLNKKKVYNIIKTNKNKNCHKLDLGFKYIQPEIAKIINEHFLEMFSKDK